MRHRKSGRKLNRTASHRKAMLSNLANALFEKKEIKTTTAKAKEARSAVERLITYAKKGDTHHRRLAFGFLRNKETTKMLFDEIGPAFSDRPGGYTRVLKLGRRQGDGASLSLLQLVGFEKLTDVGKPEKKKTRKKETPKAEKTEKAAAEAKEAEATGEAETVDQEPQPETPEEQTEKKEEKGDQ